MAFDINSSEIGHIIGPHFFDNSVEWIPEEGSFYENFNENYKVSTAHCFLTFPPAHPCTEPNHTF